MTKNLKQDAMWHRPESHQLNTAAKQAVEIVEQSGLGLTVKITGPVYGARFTVIDRSGVVLLKVVYTCDLSSFAKGIQAAISGQMQTREAASLKRDY